MEERVKGKPQFDKNIVFVCNQQKVHTIKISGNIGLIVDIGQKIPDGYRLGPTQPRHLLLNGPINQDYVVEVVAINTPSKTDAELRFEQEGKNHQMGMIENTIHFLNLEGEEVGQSLVAGKANWFVSVLPPEGFQFLSNYWDFIKISDAIPNQQLFVEECPQEKMRMENNPIPSEDTFENEIVFQEVEKSDQLLTVYDPDKEVHIYDNQGLITLETVENFFDYPSTRQGFLHGEKYFEIKTNKWLKADSVAEYELMKQSLRVNHPETRVFNLSGRICQRSRLEKNALCKADRMMVQEEKIFYRIQESSWLNSDDVVIL